MTVGLLGDREILPFLLTLPQFASTETLSTNVLTTMLLTPHCRLQHGLGATLDMTPQAGTPVTGANFFNRDAELRLLDAKV